MASDVPQDRESLSSSTVAQLREICKNRGLIVSGKKADLIDRILEDSGVSITQREGEEKTEDGSEWENDALVLDDEGETRQKVEDVLSKIKGEVVEAELIDAELVEEEPQIPDDDQPSLVITMPTLSSLGERWKATAAVVVVVILVTASATIFLQRSSGFTVSELRYGDSMNFNVMESNVRIVGEEMLGIVRDSTGEILEDACNELAIEINDGSGSVSVTDGSDSGAISTTCLLYTSPSPRDS